MSEPGEGADESTFLGRWSRRKVAARRGETLPEPAAPPPASPVAASAAAHPEPALDLPALDTLKGLESEYEVFMRPGIDPATRTAALKKLFGDPHFNTMDGLDVYIDDYSIADPIPTAMLRALGAARTLGLFDEGAGGADANAPDGAAAAEAIPEALPATADAAIARPRAPEADAQAADLTPGPDAA